MGRWIAGRAPLIALALALAGGALAQQPAPPAPAEDAARAAFEALPESERKALQDALVWTGDYKSTLDGGFGRGTRDALAAYGARMKIAGPLTPPQRAALLKQAETRKAAAGFHRIVDARSGAALALPTRLLTRRVDTPTGSRWSDAQGAAQIETFRGAGEGDTLARLFDALRAEQPGRRIGYRVLRPDFMVVSGEDPRGLFYTRAALGGDPARPVIRGYTLVYAQALKPSFDVWAIAISNGFEPFPAAAPAAGAPAAAPAGPEATAVTVAPGLALTVLPAGCEAPRLGGQAARVVARAPSGLALLEAKTAAGRPLAPAAEAGPADLALFLAAGAKGAPELTAAPAEARGAAILAALQDGAPGAAVFDAAGGWIGLARPAAGPPRLVAGVRPRTPYPLIPAAEAAAFLKQAAVPPAAPAPGKATTAADVARLARGSLSPVTCGR
ncbi:MAG TPA: serine protease [Beijerinckiaceae bacterium]